MLVGSLPTTSWKTELFAGGKREGHAGNKKGKRQKDKLPLAMAMLLSLVAPRQATIA